MADWTNIKTALKTMVANMTIANGFNFDWVTHDNKKIPHPEVVYVAVTSGDEENFDEAEFVSSNIYRQKRLVKFYVKVKTQTSVTLDNCVDECEDLLELAKKDLIKNYGSAYNIAGNAGAEKIMYQGLEYTDVNTSDMYSPKKMNVIFLVTYQESRGL